MKISDWEKTIRLGKTFRLGKIHLTKKKSIRRGRKLLDTEEKLSAMGKNFQNGKEYQTREKSIRLGINYLTKKKSYPTKRNYYLAKEITI